MAQYWTIIHPIYLLNSIKKKGMWKYFELPVKIFFEMIVGNNNDDLW